MAGLFESLRKSFSRVTPAPAAADNSTPTVGMIDKIDDILNGKEKDPASLDSHYQIFPMKLGSIAADEVREVNSSVPRAIGEMLKDGKLTGRELLVAILSDGRAQQMKIEEVQAIDPRNIQRAREILRGMGYHAEVKSVSDPDLDPAIRLAKFATLADWRQRFGREPDELTQFINDLHRDLTSPAPMANIDPDFTKSPIPLPQFRK